jgi:hypothetical protein
MECPPCTTARDAHSRCFPVLDLTRWCPEPLTRRWSGLAVRSDAALDSTNICAAKMTPGSAARSACLAESRSAGSANVKQHHAERHTVSMIRHLTS